MLSHTHEKQHVSAKPLGRLSAQPVSQPQRAQNQRATYCPSFSFGSVALYAPSEMGSGMIQPASPRRSLGWPTQERLETGAVNNSLAGSRVGGPARGEDGGELIGGVLDTLRDIGDVASTGLGNVVGGVAAVASGIDINTTDTSAPAWSPHGNFLWHITWKMSGRNVGASTNGWLVQKVENTYSGQDSAGRAIDNARIGATPSYYEAWPVVAGVVQQPWGGASDDTWSRPDLSVYPPVADGRTKGRWSMLSKAYFTATDPTAHGLAPHNVADAGDLPSSVAAPPGLGLARLHRYAHGTWDSTVAPPRHTGGNR